MLGNHIYVKYSIFIGYLDIWLLGTFFNSSCIKINIKIVQNCCRKLTMKGLKTTFGTVKS